MPIRALPLTAGVVAACAVACSSPASELLVTSYANPRIARFTPGGAYLGNYDDGGRLDGVLCARVGPDGLVYAASELTNSIIRFNPFTMSYYDTFVPNGRGGLNGPTGVTWDPDGNLVVSSFNSNSVLKYDGRTGASLGQLVRPGVGTLRGPDNGTTFGPDGNLYVPSFFTNKVIKYDGRTGAVMLTFSLAISQPRVLVFHAGELLVTSESLHSVRRFNPTTGAYLGDFISPHAGGLSDPVGLAFDDAFAYVSSGDTNRIFRFDAATGAFVDTLTNSGDGGLSFPSFITVVPTPSAAAAAVWGGLIACTRRRRAAGV